MSLVEQRYTTDCAVACLAMFTGKSYDEISELLYFHFNLAPPVQGLNNTQVAWILKSLGYKPLELKIFIHGCPMIISVASSRSKFHMVFYDGHEILDPASNDKLTMTEFIAKFPLSDAIICKQSIGWGNPISKFFSKIKIPRYYYSEFDFNQV